MTGSRRFVVLTTYSRSLEARVTASRLDRAQIEWELEDGALSIRNHVASRVFRRVKLKVRSRDYERARDLLDLGCAQIGPRAGTEPDTCPECGHGPSLIGRVGAMFRRDRRHRCEACGHWWGS